jgi:hypothetical protein
MSDLDLSGLEKVTGRWMWKRKDGKTVLIQEFTSHETGVKRYEGTNDFQVTIPMNDGSALTNTARRTFAINGKSLKAACANYDRAADEESEAFKKESLEQLKEMAREASKIVTPGLALPPGAKPTPTGRPPLRVVEQGG